MESLAISHKINRVSLQPQNFLFFLANFLWLRNDCNFSSESRQERGSQKIAQMTPYAQVGDASDSRDEICDYKIEHVR